MTISPPAKVRIEDIKPFLILASGFDSLDLAVNMNFNTYQESSYMNQTAYNKALNKPTQFTSYNYGVELNFKF